MIYLCIPFTSYCKTLPWGICLKGPTEPDGASKSGFLAENYTTRQTITRGEEFYGLTFF